MAMNINFFITSLGGGGAERVVCNLANYLVGHRHTVKITVLRGDDKTYPLDEKVTVEYLQPEYYHSPKSTFYRLKEIRTTIGFLIHLPKETLLVSLLELPVAYSLIFRRCFSQRLVICERNNPEFYSKWYQRIFKNLACKAYGCVCQTSEIMDWYRERLSSKCRTAIIPNTINNDVLNASICERKEKVIMTMGRLEPQKNQAMLISAFADLANDYPDYKLAIYGKGPLEQDLNEQINSLNLQGRVEMRGFTKDVIEAYHHSDIFVLTSNHEGMPNVLAEAMAMGLPCISTDCGGGGAKELINDGINGIIVPKNDKSALVESIRKLIENRVYADNLSHEAVLIKKRLSPEVIHKQWETFFDNIY